MIYYFARLFSKISCLNKQNLAFVDDNYLLQHVIRENKSLVRFGDGEAALLFYKSIYYQKSSISIAYNLFCVLTSSNHNLVKCFPENSCNSNFELLNMITNLLPITRGGKLIGSANIFREESNLELQDIEKIWLKKKKIILVCSNYKYMSDFKEKYQESEVFIVQCRGANSFQMKGQVFSKVESIIDDLTDDEKKDSVIITASGPLSKPLAMHFCNLGVQSIDLGHFFDYKFYNLKRDEKL